MTTFTWVLILIIVWALAWTIRGIVEEEEERRKNSK